MGLADVDGAAGLLLEPKPLNSGTSFVGEGGFAALLSIVKIEVGGGVMGDGEAILPLGSARRLSVLVSKNGWSGFSGEIDRARSAAPGSVVVSSTSVKRRPLTWKQAQVAACRHSSQTTNIHTRTSRHPFRPALLHFLFQLAISLRVFSFALLRQFPHGFQEGCGVEVFVDARS